MKLSEANAINTLLSALAGRSPYQSMTPDLPPDADELAHAVLQLATAARSTLENEGWVAVDAVKEIVARHRAGVFMPDRKPEEWVQFLEGMGLDTSTDEDQVDVPPTAS